MEKKYNIVFICTDQMRANAYGYINKNVITPNLDFLAENGAVFTNAFCSNPVCTPSRASMFTGRYAEHTGAWNIGTELNENEKTICDYLKEKGYYNIGIGKTHFRPQLKDFTFKFEEVEYRDRVRKTDNTYYGFDETEITEDDKLGKYLEYVKNNGYYLEAGKGNDGINKIPEHLHQTYWIGMKSVEKIKKYDFSKKPLFLWVSFVDPHHPFDPIEKFVKLYENMPHESKIEKVIDKNRPKHLRKQYGNYWPGGGEEHNYTDDEIYNITKWYYSMISFIDQEIGKIINAIKEKGELENTIFIFTSDHGEYLGDHGLLKKGPFMYDSVTNVPLIFYGPNILNGKREQLFENIDILPTILDMLGSDIPYGIQGTSFKSVLNGSKENIKDDVVITYDAHDRNIFIKCYRTREYKLVIYLDEDYGELYDLKNDKNETKNLFFDSKYKDIKNELMQKFLKRIIKNSNPLNKRYAPW